MSVDGGLRSLFRANLPGQWTPIETGGTAGGVPDSEYCMPGGKQGWIEFKKCEGNVIRFRPMQPGWILRRVRMGGRVFVAVRRKDEIFLFHGRDVKALVTDGLRGAEPIVVWRSREDWELIRKILSA